MWFIGVEVEQETSAPPPKKNPRSAPDLPIKCMHDNVTNTSNNKTINWTNTPYPSGISTVRPLSLYMTTLLTSHTPLPGSINSVNQT